MSVQVVNTKAGLVGQRLVIDAYTAGFAHATPRLVSQKLNEVLRAEDWGLVGDNSADNTPRFNQMISDIATYLGGARTIKFGPGEFLFKSKPNPIPVGINLVGDGNAGSTTWYGTTLVREYTPASATEPFLWWDGSLTNGFAGTGGGIHDMRIYAGTGFNGGIAIKLSGADDNHRVSFMLLNHIVIASRGVATWNKGILVDGTGLVTAGSKGIREIRVKNSNIVSCSDVDSNVYLTNAVHFYMEGCHLVPGTSANCGMTITGTSAADQTTNVFVATSNMDGNLTINYCQTVVYHGRIGGNISCNANSNNVTVCGLVGGTITTTGCGSVNLYLEGAAYLNQIIPVLVAPFDYSGVFTQPPGSSVDGMDLLRARAVSGATGTPLGFSTTPIGHGGSGIAYLGSNQNQNALDNNAQYYRAGYGAFRVGNPLGNGTYPFFIYIAPAGANQGDAITYLEAMRIHGTTGVVEHRQGITAGTTVANATAREFTMLSNDSVIDPGNILNGAYSNAVNVTVVGARIGDQVRANFSDITTGAWNLIAYVSGNDNVKVYFGNFTGGAVDLNSGTLRVTVTHFL